jgi:hypothetical protein
MTNVRTNSGDLNPLFHPAAHSASPDDVLNNGTLSASEKRVILSSWASDMYAVESVPRCARSPTGDTPSGSPTSSRRCGASTARTTIRSARAAPPCGGGLRPARGGGLRDVHSGRSWNGVARPCLGGLDRALSDAFVRLGGTVARSKVRPAGLPVSRRISIRCETIIEP